MHPWVLTEQDQALGVGVPVSNVWSSLPGLKRTAFPGVMLTSVPVRGLRPIPVLRARTENTPKPRNSMRSPAARASFKPSNTVSTAASAFVRGRPVRSITWCTMSCLIKAVTSLARLFSTVPRPTGLMVQPLPHLWNIVLRIFTRGDEEGSRSALPAASVPPHVFEGIRRLGAFENHPL
jgi:hypothetical protein